MSLEIPKHQETANESGREKDTLFYKPFNKEQVREKMDSLEQAEFRDFVKELYAGLEKGKGNAAFEVQANLEGEEYTFRLDNVNCTKKGFEKADPQKVIENLEKGNIKPQELMANFKLSGIKGQDHDPKELLNLNYNVSVIDVFKGRLDLGTALTKSFGGVEHSRKMAEQAKKPVDERSVEHYEEVKNQVIELLNAKNCRVNIIEDTNKKQVFIDTIVPQTDRHIQISSEYGLWEIRSGEKEYKNQTPQEVINTLSTTELWTVV